MICDRQGLTGNGHASRIIWKGVFMQKHITNVLPFRNQKHIDRKLVDGFGRSITYLRLAVTDRCNLRCRYCMPMGGIATVPSGELLTFEEITRLVGVAASCGITKIRLTGGEPFVRKDFLQLLEAISAVPGIEYVHITSNGVNVAGHVQHLQELGVAGFNLSLDSLDPYRFAAITGRFVLEAVMETLEALVRSGICVKVNVVVQEGINTDELVSLAALAESRPIAVRFIEQMPFNGRGPEVTHGWNSERILDELRRTFPNLHRSMTGSGTARIYRIRGFAGSIGVIGAYSREFCAECNKIRITSQGLLKTCLYDRGALDLRALLRDESVGNDDLAAALIQAVTSKPVNGFAAEMNELSGRESMSTIGG